MNDEKFLTIQSVIKNQREENIVVYTTRALVGRRPEALKGSLLALKKGAPGFFRSRNTESSLDVKAIKKESAKLGKKEANKNE